jgi:hypothetical protein
MRVIKRSNLPTYFPSTFTIATWLLLDRLHVSQWAWGVYWLFISFAWLGSIIAVFKEDEVDLLKERV